eukprot:403347714
MESLSQPGLKIALIGATGAIGKEIVKHAQNDERISELALIVRKRLEEWKDEDFKCKLTVLEYENYDDMSKMENDLEGYDAFMCTLGTRTKTGAENFKKVDYTYPLEFAKLAQKLNIPHYGLLTSMGANHRSQFLYMRTKGEVENAIKALNLDNLNIYRPGVLLNRDNDFRIGEKIIGWVPFISKIQSSDVGKVMLEQAVLSKSQNQVEVRKLSELSNADIARLATQYNTKL